ncbi:MAG: helix-hairpin-helix domain-containing protein [Rhodoferax sp.]|nr:helix-hairpin-helix domain-containing protein [Rhodoferax sp.]
MPRVVPGQPKRLEDLPNIGKSIAADLELLGIRKPEQLAKLDPLETYRALSAVMGHRHDPCVLYTLMSVQHFFKSDEVLPWWKFTERGKELLQSIRQAGPSAS